MIIIKHRKTSKVLTACFKNRRWERIRDYRLHFCAAMNQERKKHRPTRFQWFLTPGTTGIWGGYLAASLIYTL